MYGAFSAVVIPGQLGKPEKGVAGAVFDITLGRHTAQALVRSEFCIPYKLSPIVCAAAARAASMAVPDASLASTAPLVNGDAPLHAWPHWRVLVFALSSSRKSMNLDDIPIKSVREAYGEVLGAVEQERALAFAVPVAMSQVVYATAEHMQELMQMEPNGNIWWQGRQLDVSSSSKMWIMPVYGWLSPDVIQQQLDEPFYTRRVKNITTCSFERSETLEALLRSRILHRRVRDRLNWNPQALLWARAIDAVNDIQGSRDGKQRWNGLTGARGMISMLQSKYGGEYGSFRFLDPVGLRGASISNPVVDMSVEWSIAMFAKKFEVTPDRAYWPAREMMGIGAASRQGDALLKVLSSMTHASQRPSFPLLMAATMSI